MEEMQEGEGVYRFPAMLWRWSGHATWYWFSMPAALSEEVEARYGSQKRGWRSIPVRVTVGNTTWDTSMFRERTVTQERDLETFLIPVKTAVRKSERLEEGREIAVKIIVRLD